MCDRLIEFIKVSEGELLSDIFLTIRAMLVKLSSNCINDIWPRLWPHVFTEIITLFKGHSNNSALISALKLLEQLSAINHEQFLLH